VLVKRRVLRNLRGKWNTLFDRNRWAQAGFSEFWKAAGFCFMSSSNQTSRLCT